MRVRSAGRLKILGLLDNIPSKAYIPSMASELEFTDEFGEWWNGLGEAQQEDIDAHVREFRKRGPALPRPYSGEVKKSKHGQMRELVVQSGGKPLRIFYAFDPRRTAIIGGDKTGNKRFYEQMIPVADRLFDEHLAGLKREP